MNRLLSIPLAATLCVAMPAGAALAVTSYDARTLGMGGSSVGYSANASLAYWNPAAVGMGHNFGLFLPTVGFSLSNNLLSPADIQTLAGGLSKLGQASTGGASSNDFDQIFTNLGSAQGLNVQAEMLAEPIGFSLGKVGPGSLAFRLYGHALANANLKLSNDFSQNLNSLFFQGGFNDIVTAIGNLQKETANPNGGSLQQANTDAQQLKQKLESNMSSFIKHNGAKTTTKTLELAETTGVDAAAAFTYGQVLPVRFTALPKSQISVGATAKIFGAPGSALAGVGSFPLPGGTGKEKVSPLGGGASASINLNIDKQVTDLADAIDAFSQDQNFATGADVASKAAAFMSDGIANSSLQFSSTTPDNVGAGLDLGTAIKLDDQWSVGAALINPIMLWGATKTTYKYDLSGDAIKLIKIADERTTFRDAEPMVLRAGAAFQPQLPGRAAMLTNGLLLNAGVEAPFYSFGVVPSLQLGLEKVFFDTFAIRLGTSQLGLSPLYTAGVGIQSRFFQLNVGAGVDNPSSKVRSVALAVGLGAGF